mgnify:CR=1 FL=1
MQASRENDHPHLLPLKFQMDAKSNKLCKWELFWNLLGEENDMLEGFFYCLVEKMNKEINQFAPLRNFYILLCISSVGQNIVLELVCPAGTISAPNGHNLYVTYHHSTIHNHNRVCY